MDVLNTRKGNHLDQVFERRHYCWSLCSYFFVEFSNALMLKDAMKQHTLQQLYCIIDLSKKERKQNCAHVDHNQLDDPLPSKITYINIVDLWFHMHSVI